MAIYNSYIECENAWRTLGLNDEQANEIFDASKGWNPQQVFGDLSYHSNIFGTTYKKASWYRNFSPRIYVSIEDIDDMTNNNTYREFVFQNQTAIRFQITGVYGGRLNMTWWLVNLIDNSGYGPSSYSLITTYYDVYEAENSGVYPSEEYENPVKDKFYVTPYFSEMIDTVDDPGWHSRNCGLSWTSDLANAMLMTETPIEGVRIDDGSYDFTPDWGTYTYKYEIVNIFNDNNWSSVPDWFWTDNEAKVNVEYLEDEEDGDEGGYPTDDFGSDIIPIPDFPTVSALGTEFVNIYLPSLQNIKDFNTWLWNSTYDVDVKKNQASPMENVITFGFIPNGDDAGNTITTVANNIAIGGIDTQVASTSAATQYHEIDCGHIDVGEVHGSYLDYDSEFQIYLPYIGYKPLKSDDVLPYGVDVMYHLDILTGTVQAYITGYVKDRTDGRYKLSLLYSYVGNCFTEIPINGANYARMKQAQMNAITGTISSFGTNVVKGAMVGGVAGAIAGGAVGIGDIASGKQQYDLARPDFEHGGSLAGNTLFTYRKPYIIRTAYRFIKVSQYKNLKGVPSATYHKLKDLKGYTLVDAIVTDGLTHCTNEEQMEIARLLKEEGVYV